MAALTQAGRMQPAGLAAVEVAKADGRWAVAYAPQREAGLPDDLMAALAKNTAAGAAFDKLDKTGQYAVVLPLLKAMTPEIRGARLEKAVAKLEKPE
ncbi:YdeI/OmpD-associated family protein [Neorhizobium vignae]|uniref:YdeI/OmpD-associated family protein n=1 Tax=Neorhizobium vignae TaxID=690585 RepID=UPI000AC42589|nr:YdeI/OmpD-associated family protein [Neorhizobium vignae]